jgi:hypothetical protein
VLLLCRLAPHEPARCYRLCLTSNQTDLDAAHGLVLFVQTRSLLDTVVGSLLQLSQTRTLLADS